jgi:hypothetical protein
MSLIAASVGACSILAPNPRPALTTVAFPGGCAAYGMSQRRCDAVVEEAKQEAQISNDQVESIELTSEPPCDPDPQILCEYTTGFAANVRFHLVGGGSTDQQIRCSVGSEYLLVCTETPTIRTGGTAMGGYRDVPCADENGGGCATPLPTFEPKAAAAARPLDIPALDIPIDHEGHYRVEIGHAVLPNGVITNAAFTLADPKTQTVEIDPETGVQLTIVSTDPNGRPFDNYYQHGWHTGTEEAVVALEFDVTRFDPGAVLAIRSLVVR